LPYPSKPLEFGRVEQRPNHLLKVANSEFDEVVNRVPNALWLGHRTTANQSVGADVFIIEQIKNDINPQAF
jgi:hypothetical protein